MEGNALGAHGTNPAANDAATMHKRPFLARNDARCYGKDHANQLGHQRPHLSKA